MQVAARKRNQEGSKRRVGRRKQEARKEGQETNEREEENGYFQTGNTRKVRSKATHVVPPTISLNVG